ncbi:hypothetical protein ACTPEN_19925, partial [Clostridioides difficile]
MVHSATQGAIWIILGQIDKQEILKQYQAAIMLFDKLIEKAETEEKKAEYQRNKEVEINTMAYLEALLDAGHKKLKPDDTGKPSLSNGSEVSSMAKIGDTLPQTKTGWKMYDDSYINILYSKRYDRVSLGTCYRGSCSYVLNVPPDETNINFTFIGTKIRLFCVKFNDRSDIVDIDIDGIVEQFNTKENIDNTSKVVYEKLDLDNKVHKVKISVNKESQSVHFLFDCVDIDEDGYILSPIVGRLTQRTSVEDMEIGDIISCKYTATTAGKIGEFSELGVCNCEEIPRDVSSPTPNGKFFFIKVDDNKLIAD